jgi:fructose-1,6-bisphosphatase I
MSQTLNQHLAIASRRFGWIDRLDLIISEIATVTVDISRRIRNGSIEPAFSGYAGEINASGEPIAALDKYANELMKKRLAARPEMVALASEEEKDIVDCAGKNGTGDFFVTFDPVDGSSNIDVNAAIGTIFSIYHRSTLSHSRADLLFTGEDQIAAGYVTYGASTHLVYTARNGVHGFTLNPATETYVQTEAYIQIPHIGGIYSINEGNRARWTPAQRALIAEYQEHDEARRHPLSSRYIGSLVADFHRTLLKGGIFIYPGDPKSPDGKLRYLYECAPLALICETAGGAATNGERRILALTPRQLHQRVPLFIGSRSLVDHATDFLSARRRLASQSEVAQRLAEAAE